MNKDTVIGIGVGVLIGWLLWRRRGMAAMFAAGAAGGCGCNGGSLAAGTAAGAAPGACARMFSAGLGNYSQQTGPDRPVY